MRDVAHDAAAHVSAIGLAEVEEVGAIVVEPDLAGGAQSAGEEADDGERSRRFAAATVADEAVHRATSHLE